jgi:excisionase family DNA binding protein
MSEEKKMSLTVADVSMHLNYSKATIRKLAKQGKLPFLMLGSRKMIFSRRVIDEIIAKGGKFGASNNNKLG